MSGGQLLYLMDGMPRDVWDETRLAISACDTFGNGTGRSDGEIWLWRNVTEEGLKVMTEENFFYTLSSRVARVVVTTLESLCECESENDKSCPSCVKVTALIGDKKDMRDN